MNYARFSDLKSEALNPIEKLVNWVDICFNEPLSLNEHDQKSIDDEVKYRRRGIKYFTGGNYSVKKPFANFMFKDFPAEEKEEYFPEVSQFLRMAKATKQIAPKSANSKDLGPFGVLAFSTDAQGYMYGIICSHDYPLKKAFDFVQSMIKLYENVNIQSALDGTDPSVWEENPEFSTDVFGIRPLAQTLWKKFSRPGDGTMKA